MTKTRIYDPIEDWTVEGRRRLVETRGDEIRALLDLAFTDFVDSQGVGLSAYGFYQEDPVGEAVEWTMDRFMTAEIDPSRLHPGSRSFRLFTEARFWLHQKVGRNGYARIQFGSVGSYAQHAKDDKQQGIEPESALAHEKVQAFGRRLAITLRTLRHNTCADLVGFWLGATKTLRREWFGWRETGEISTEAGGLSKKQRSFYGHDAMFRFLCFLHELVSSNASAPAKLALRSTTLSPCENSPPYRVPDRAIVANFVASGVKGSRDVAHLRKEGARQCVRDCLALASSNDFDVSNEGFSVELTRRSLGPTTLHALGIEDDAILREQINGLSKVTAESAT